jgi:hypothetical protein
MKTKVMRTCQYRKCGRVISEAVNGNLRYCPAETDNAKESCSYKERKLRQRETVAKNKVLLERQAKLENTLKLIMNGVQVKNVTEDRFMKYISPYVDLFEQKYLGGTPVYWFRNFSMYKLVVGENVLIKIMEK